MSFIMMGVATGWANIIIDPPAGMPAKFALDKTICTIDPFSLNPPESCELAPIVTSGMPVYYLFTLNNPWGEPAQTVTLTDPMPSGFNASGKMTCKDSAGAPALVTDVAGTLGKVYLGLGEKLSCVVEGNFNSAGYKNNTVTGTNHTGYSIDADVNTTVVMGTPVGADLSVSKSVSPSAVDVTNGAQTVAYTIKVKNQSSTGVDLGDHFKLHDKMALRPDSVPLRVEYLSSSCTATPGTDCLDTVSPFVYGSPETLVGTAGQNNFVRFEFPSSSLGHIEPGGEITLTVNAKVRWLPGLSCEINSNANGIRNTAFFTLLNNQGSAMVESNWANNTDTIDLKVTSANKTQKENCAKGHLYVSKKQNAPLPTNDVSWGQMVTYEIKLANDSFPSQPLTFKAGDFQDWVTQGINTPPFVRKHGNTVCTFSTDPGFCAKFNNSFAADPTFKYSYYTETNRAWSAGSPTLTLKAGHKAVINTQLQYRDPDCETVPAAPEKPIINTARLKYFATEYGALSAGDPKIGFTVSDSAKTKMKDQPPCKFKVTKKPLDPSPNTKFLFFNKAVNYEVTFENLGSNRNVGTVIDRLRLSHGDYAKDLPYNSQFTCSDNGGVTGYKTSDTINGVLNHTSTPAQGSDALDLRSDPTQPLYFKSGGKLTCQVSVTVKRPKLNRNLCTFDQRRLQNMAMMDVTYPFNSSIYWAPSGTYNATAFVNPAPQNKNWAMAEHKLPLCQDIQLNKSASVDGLPGNSKDWTYEGGPSVDYKLTYTNTTKSSIRGAGSANNWNTLGVSDVFQAPYSSINTAGDSCASSSTCQLMNGGSGRKIGIDDMSQNQSGVWTFEATGPFQKGQDIKNCAIIEELGEADPAKGVVYQNYARPVSMNSASNQRGCVTVPVINLTQINITKQINDLTGAGITSGGPFEFTASCSPYDLFIGDEKVTINAGQTGTINRVPVRSSCTISETSMPDVPAAAHDACRAENPLSSAKWTSSVTPSTISNPLSANSIAVTAANTLSCAEVEKTGLAIIKSLTLPDSFQGVFPELSYTINANCSPAAIPASQTITLDNSSAVTTSFTMGVGAECTFTEDMPAFPQVAKDYCSPLNALGFRYESVPVWKDPLFNVSMPHTITGKKPRIMMQNSWECETRKKKINYHEILNGGFQIAQVTPIEITRDVRLRHKLSNQCLYSNSGSGNLFRHWACWADPAMVFEKIPVAGGKYQFKHKISGQCLKATSQNGGEVTTANCSSATHTEFVSTGANEGRLKQGGQCMYTTSNDGGKTHNWGCWADPGMVFTLDPA